mgnify:CR=1 FL=1
MSDIKCEVCGREDLKTKNKNNKHKMILCNKHYAQMSRNGKILINSCRERNIIEKLEDKAEILIYNLKQEIVARCIIDLEDVEKCRKYRWRRIGDGRICTTINGKNSSINRFLLNPNKEHVVDHIDGNILNNKKSNLRIATTQQNCFNSDRSKYNTSGKVGVRKHGSGFQAFINISGKFINLGCYKIKKDAIDARVLAEKKHHKEFRCKRGGFFE